MRLILYTVLNVMHADLHQLVLTRHKQRRTLGNEASVNLACLSGITNDLKRWRTLELFYRLMSFTRGRRYLLVLGLVCAVGVALSGIAIPWLVKEGIDRAFLPDGPRDPDLLVPLAGGQRRQAGR